MIDEKLTLEQELANEIAIDDLKLDEEMLRQPSKFFYWGSQWARAMRRLAKEELILKELESNLSKEFREMMANSKPDLRVTEKMINEYTASHPDYLTQTKTVMDWENTERLLNIAKEAMRQRYQVILDLRKYSLEAKIYGDEFKAMSKEYEQRKKKTKGE
jgi:hypothetical protein